MLKVAHSMFCQMLHLKSSGAWHGNWNWQNRNRRLRHIFGTLILELCRFCIKQLKMFWSNLTNIMNIFKDIKMLLTVKGNCNFNVFLFISLLNELFCCCCCCWCNFYSYRASAWVPSPIFRSITTDKKYDLNNILILIKYIKLSRSWSNTSKYPDISNVWKHSDPEQIYQNILISLRIGKNDRTVSKGIIIKSS